MSKKWPTLDEVLGEIVERVAHEKLLIAKRGEALLVLIEARFGRGPQDLAEQIRSILDSDHLMDLIRKAASAPDLDTFRKELSHQPSAK